MAVAAGRHPDRDGRAVSTVAGRRAVSNGCGRRGRRRAGGGHPNCGDPERARAEGRVRPCGRPPRSESMDARATAGRVHALQGATPSCPTRNIAGTVAIVAASMTPSREARNSAGSLAAAPISRQWPPDHSGERASACGRRDPSAPRRDHDQTPPRRDCPRSAGEVDDQRPPGYDTVIDRFAARQHGVVARSQLLGAGVPPHVIEYRIKSRRLRRLYRGVYGVGPVQAPLRPVMAAILASGAGAVISHQSAAILRDMVPRAADRPSRIHVSRPGACRRPGPGVCVHRVAALAPLDRRSSRGFH